MFSKIQIYAKKEITTINHLLYFSRIVLTKSSELVGRLDERVRTGRKSVRGQAGIDGE